MYHCSDESRPPIFNRFPIGSSRGQIRAAYQFVFNVVGFGAGPFLVALSTDYVFGYDEALRYSLVLVAAIIGPLAVWLTWYGMKPYAASVVRSRSWA